MMEHIFIINPAAGHSDKTAEYTAKIQEACEGLDYRIEVSKGPGDCTRIAREAAGTGGQVRLYACGGDGTLNEVVAGAAGYDNAAVTCYSGGSGNDFVKLFGSKEPFMDLKRLLDCQEAVLDLIDCNGRLGINTCCLGLDANIGVDVQKYKRLPLVNGSAAYILSTAVNLFKGTHDHYVVEVGGVTIDDEQTLICAANGQWYGGTFHAMPDAVPDDGLLDLLIVRELPLHKLPGVIAKYQHGRYKEFPELARHLRTDRLRIRCDRESVVALDGEEIRGTEFDIRISDKKIRFFYPRGLHYK